MLAISTCLDSIRGCADAARRCAEPFVTSQLTIRTQRWSGGRLGLGSRVVDDLVLPKRFPFRELASREVASSGGRYEQGDLAIDGISPPFTSHGGGGFSLAQLDPMVGLPKPCLDTEVLYIVDGDETGTYSLVSIDSSDPTEWSMVIRRTRLSRPMP